ncbi:hypothetical protein [Rubinisphaera margarita]|uniref:hypothetical protein n=1 Tax=Rubinisphaera margarita TaxID=2909586 RepID=UPI001EE8302C|nr:hypothetical protein [Rubinisphaera margarita]MCG6156362.1 hypothetical protein [Rubinisphaera margarita]
MTQLPDRKMVPFLSLLLFVMITNHSELDAEEPAEFFRVEQIDGEWKLLNPSGEPFYMRGVNHYGDGSGMPWNLIETHGSVENWRKSLRDRNILWGFNYLPPSIGPTAIDPATVAKPHGHHNLIKRTPEWSAEQYAELDFPFTIFLEYPRQYMSGSNLPDVFSKEFEQGIEERCRAVCKPLKNNRNLIGYHYTQNPPWHPQAKSFDLWIDDITKSGMAGRTAWIALMRQIYGSTDRWSAVYGIPIDSWSEIETLENPLRGYVNERKHLADREAFMQRICERWYKVHRDAIRRYDPSHLILGDRNTLHLQPLPEYAIRVMKPYVDVLSVNVMGPPQIAYEVLEDATRVWDGPIHLADTGAGIYSGGVPKSTYQARDLAEFEKVYAGMMQMGVEHPQIIGFGWCGFYETPHPGGRAGLVDVATGEPLRDRLHVVQRWNEWIKIEYQGK